MQKSENAYAVEVWRIHRMRKTSLLVCATGLFLASVSSALPEAVSTAAFIASCLCLAFAVVFGTLVFIRSCPRCGETLFLKWYWHNVFSSKCLHCGLSLRPRDYQKREQFVDDNPS
jgi:hypothetical protein